MLLFNCYHNLIYCISNENLNIVLYQSKENKMPILCSETIVNKWILYELIKLQIKQFVL